MHKIRALFITFQFHWGEASSCPYLDGSSLLEIQVLLLYLTEPVERNVSVLYTFFDTKYFVSLYVQIRNNYQFSNDDCTSENSISSIWIPCRQMALESV